MSVSPSVSEMELEIEHETAMLKEIQNKLAKDLDMPKIPLNATKYVPPTAEEQKDIDSRSIHVGNLDWFSKKEEVEEHFKGCGAITRITIPKDKRTQRQKNFAYVELDSVESVQNALLLNGSLFRSRPITVTAKRTNVPGMSVSKRGGPAHRGGRNEVIVKYVYVNGPARGGRGAPRGRRFNPY